jgi:hypothetical protein
MRINGLEEVEEEKEDVAVVVVSRRTFSYNDYMHVFTSIHQLDILCVN